MNLYVVRHGQTDWNIQGVIQGLSDIELNDVGIQQANIVAEGLKDINFEAIYVSPLKRTVSTANSINKYHNLEIITDNRIIERCFGNFEGTRNLFNDTKYEYWDYDKNLDINNVESISTLFERVYSFLHDLSTKYQNQDCNILVVTHGGTCIAINAIINNITKDLFDLGIKNCEVKIFKNVKLDKKEN